MSEDTILQEVQTDPDHGQEGGCCCLSYIVVLGLVIWVLSRALGIGKAILAGLVMSLATILLSLVGVIPVLGQWLFKQFAGGIIAWAYHLLRVEPSVQLSVPRWINTVLVWILDVEKIDGSLASYTFAVGYSFSIMLSISTVGYLILWIVSAVQRRRRAS